MKIKTKTIIALVVTTICLLLILDVVSNDAIQSQFTAVEQSEVTQTIERMNVAVTNSYLQMGSELVSWSQLNNTYDFMQNQTSDEYRETYLTNSSLDNLGVNFVVFLNTSGQVVASMGLNLTTMNQAPIPQDFITRITSDSLIWDQTSLDSNTEGFILSQGQPLMLAARPILMTNGEGPARGVLVFARYYDAVEVRSLSQIMSLPPTAISINLFDSWKETNSIQNSSSMYIKPVNQTSIMGYDVVDDVRGQQPLFVIGALMPRTIYDQGLATVGLVDEVLLLAGVIFTITIVLIMQYSVLRRLGKLTDAVIKLGKLDEEQKDIPVSGNDEITWLTLSINGMLQKIQSQGVKIQKSERLSAIGELARQIGHDLRNPLASSKNAVYYLKNKGNKCSEENRQKMLEIIDQDISRTDKIITDLIDYSSEIYLETDQCSPKSLLEGAISTLQVPSNIEILDETLKQPIMSADVDKIQKTFTFIAKNAFDAMPNGGTLKIISTVHESDVEITFSDTGVGIPKELLPKIFAPLLTTKAQGMGLSLAICKRFVDSHGGKIEVESILNEGTTFKITLPIKAKIDQSDKEEAILRGDPLLHYDATKQSL